jgi:hypothetical protein
MTMLQQLDFNYDQCLKETQEFQKFLGGHQSLKERDEILPFFKARQHLSAFLGAYNAHMIRYDRVAHEYPLFGDFVCDLVVGDWERRSYMLVEFENAAPDSLFVKKKKETPEWSPRLEHGFSQILDWFYKLDTQRHAPDFEQRFGARVVHLSGLLIVGRRQDFGLREKDRLRWRQQHVLIQGNQIHCLTFDDLCDDLLTRLTTYPALQKELKAAGQPKGTDNTATTGAPAQGTGSGSATQNPPNAPPAPP